MTTAHSEMFRLERRDDIGLIVFDVPGAAVNTLRAGFEVELSALLDGVQADPELRAAVLTSGKPGSFVAGADLDMLRQVRTVDEGVALSRAGQRAFDRLATSAKPLVAAIHGTCLGGGLELTLACSARIASDDPATRLGQPEVLLGVIPGAGGTQRLLDLVGLEAALDLVVSGREVSASRARHLGLVDEVVPHAILLDVACEAARRLANVPAVRERDRRRSLARRLRSGLLEDTQAGRALMFRQAEAQVRARTHGTMPAPLRAIEVLRAGAERGAVAGFTAEAEAFGELVVSPQARNLIRVFNLRQTLRREARNVGAAPRVGKVAIVGAGLMGAGIAAVTIGRAELPVRLKDVDRAALRRGMQSICAYLDGRVQRRRISAHERDRLLSLVHPDTAYRGFGGVDLVIEAVVEDLSVKQQVCKEIADVTGPDTIFASNTSSIPIDQIAQGHPRPELVVGMHYFSPVPRVPLLEVVEGPRTAEKVTAAAVDVGRRQGMTVVVVGDGPGFFTSRVLAPYINEAGHLLEDGASVAVIDQAFEQLGFPVGPFRLIDEVGIDVATKISRVLTDGLGERLTAAPVMAAVVADGRLGRKNGRGFYLYQSQHSTAERGAADPSIYQLVQRRPGSAPDHDEIVDRGLLTMVNETVWTLGDGVLRSARAGDAAAIFGLGFPPHLGGPLRYLDDRGAAAVLRRLRDFQERLGPRFAPAPKLVELAESGERLTYPA